MAALDNEIAAYERMKTELEKHHFGKFVLVHNGELVGAFDSEDAVIREGLRRFGSAPFLVRKVGEPQIKVPTSAHVFRPIHANR